MPPPVTGGPDGLFVLEKRWRPWLIILSFFVSFLGAYTTTQLYVQCRQSTLTAHRIGWLVLAAVEFGGCAIWAFHFVAMIALDIGVPVDFNLPMTIFSAFVAVVGMLGGLASNIWIKMRRKRSDMYLPIANTDNPSENGTAQNPLSGGNDMSKLIEYEGSTSEFGTILSRANTLMSKGAQEDTTSLSTKILQHLRRGLSLRVFVVGAMMSLGICAMHYIGMKAMYFDGIVKWNNIVIVLSVLIAYVVSMIALIFLPNESDGSSQIVFAVVAAIGISLMHWTGMWAATFYTRRPPPYVHGSIPTVLPLGVAFIAIISCLMSYVVLARTITQSRDRLAEMIVTRRKLWKALAEKEAAERNDKVKTEFISVASHELRTPLHAITGFVDLLALTPLNDEQMSFVKSIQGSCHALDLITKNVLDFTRLENDHSETAAEVSDVRVKDLVFDMLQTCMTKISNALSVDIIIHIERGVPDVFRVDETYFARVLMNLVGNAMKFTRRGYIMVRMSICTDENALCVCVSDTGIGISQASQNIVFEPFRQADTSLTRKHLGTGLGLAICKQLVTKMNGRISLESQEGRGADFTFVVPGLKRMCYIPPPIQTDIKVGIWLRSHRSSMAVQWALSPHFATRTVDTFDYQQTLVGVERVIVDYKCLTPQIISEIIGGDGNQRWFIFYSDESVKELRNLANVTLLKRPICIEDLLARQLTRGWAEPQLMRRASISVNPALEELKRMVAVPSPLAQSPILEIPPEVQETGDVVLLVEDNPINQQLGVKMLTKLGRTVDVAENGMIALEKLMENRSQYGLVLMDSQMPVLSGPSTCRRIRALEASGQLPGRLRIISLTANVDPISQRECLEAGSDCFLPKPLTLRALRDELEEIGMIGVAA
ncbi:hypothetical protein TWF696_009542 [Orbilia brochopaga]|uniref:Histidine kinase n=1 Tax=Orbilia brochopaga TaxID=3140254 RepID=A0AAV9UAY9_9PEZI